MLQLKDIKKDYSVAGEPVHALKGISVNFRKSEFVSILGPSGCGKTTLLNIIGGLDKYTSGDLIIEGRSTKQYGDRDWDTYRNHSIGFIFQSYHLIPHQTILQNVELALMIAGVSKAERRQRAIDALEKVGLSDKINSRPNQLSGGQAQRVAIARALINDPEIVLADEPTGALDSVTSVQIMELLKEISKDRLVIMVTHNPELAEEYSTRIVRLLDGEVVGDSMPFDGVEETPVKEQPFEQNIAEESAEEVASEKKTNKGKKKKTAMSTGMAMGLSFKNLLSKKKRTAMVSVAGSIGIIGVSMVLAISSGVKGYIRNMEEDMLAGNPIVITESAIDFASIMDNMPRNEQKEGIKIEDGVVNVTHMVEFLYERGQAMDNIIVSNDITEEYINYVASMPEDYYAAIDFNYGLDLSNNLYTDYSFTNHDAKMSLSGARQMFTAMLERTEFAEYASYITTLADTFLQAPDNPDFILSQYDLISPNGKIATAKDEIMIVVNDEHELSDLLLAQLGYYTQEEFFNIVHRVTGGSRYDATLDINSFKFEDLLGKTFTWYPNNTVYKRTAFNPLNPAEMAFKPFTYNYIADNSWTTGLDLKLTGILVLKEKQNYGCLDSGFYYTSALSKYIVENSKDSEIVQVMNASGQDTINGMKDTIIRDPDNDDNDTNKIYEGDIGITYNYSYYFEGKEYTDTGFVGSRSAMGTILGSMFGLANPYTLTLREVGGCSIPDTINIYPSDFNYKNYVTDYLDAWNDDGVVTVNGVEISGEDRARIVYSDTVGLIINMINTMIEMITIALIAFTALSLVVSTVMIGIITYVSVVERIKEIGILRAVGARKKDIKSLFNAETFIIGLVAGIIGILITYILSLIINVIVMSLAGIWGIAALPWWQAIIMVLLSVGLTLISGLIPAASAAKKDPVVALRTE